MTASYSELSLGQLARYTNQATLRLTHSGVLPDVLSKLFQRIGGLCHVKKGYVVDFKRGEHEYRLVGFVRPVGWTVASKRLFADFLGKGGWKLVQRGKLYKKMFSRDRPFDPYPILDWQDPRYGVHETLCVPEADVAAALAIPFAGERQKLYLAMLMFESRPVEPLWENLLSMVMGRIAYSLFSRENAKISTRAPARKLADSFSDLLTPRELGWDTIDHCQRVRFVCDALAENLGFSRDDRFSMALAASCHDVGKQHLKQSVRTIYRLLEQKLAGTKRNRLSASDRSDKRIYLAHPQLGALKFLEKLVKLGLEEDAVRYWLLPILCHHARNDLVGRQKFTRRGIEKVMEALGTEGNTSAAVLSKFRGTHGENHRVVQATDCLRIADFIEDHAGWKHHRPEADATITAAIERAIEHAKSHGFGERVARALAESQDRIVDFYEGLGRV